MPPATNTLAPAHPVVEKLGGRRAVAEHLGLSISAIHRWCSSPPKGTGGRIPHKHWVNLMLLAEKRKQRLTIKTLSGL